MPARTSGVRENLHRSERPSPQECSRAVEFGGHWTIEKLNVLERYLNAYTTVLKKTPFGLIYIDAFAGSGTIHLGTPDPQFWKVVKGSASLAVEVRDRRFDHLVFVEKDAERCKSLEVLKRHNARRRIEIVQAEANGYLQDLELDRTAWRGVLFVDPFATQVEWATIDRIASLEALDMWLLFPLSAIARMLPTSKRPEEIDPAWASRLSRIYGDENWRDLYKANPQQQLFGDPNEERAPGVNGLLEIYKDNLKRLFGNRLLGTSRTLYTANNTPLFELMFCVGSPSGIGPATKIAKHILDHF